LNYVYQSFLCSVRVIANPDGEINSVDRADFVSVTLSPRGST